MNSKFIQRIKRSIVKIQGVNRNYNFDAPYLLQDEYESGGTGFFVNPKEFGSKFPLKRNCRYILTNFHVVQHFSNRNCLVEWPERNQSYMICEVRFVSPNLDFAILELDVGSLQPKWWTGDHIQWLETIKNCPLNTKDIVKGCSQSIKAIGFPNLQNDYMISDGTLSSRGLGMLSLDLSINAGNSGGPLFLKNKVIGICTATICDSERLALAVPIQEIFRFLNYWTNYDTIILRLPCWGMGMKKLTMDYMDYKGIDHAFTGALVKSTIKDQACANAGLKKGDILMGIETKDNNGKVIKYKIDNFGQVEFCSTDKRVRIDSVEYLLNLDPDYLVIHYYRRKKIHQVHVHLQPIDFKVRLRYPTYEEIEWTVFGGMIFSDLHLNMLTVDAEEEEEEEEVAFDHSLLNDLKKSQGMESIVIVTHIIPQSYITFASELEINDRIIKINNTKVKDTTHLIDILDKLAGDYYKGKSASSFITLKTQNNEHVLSLEKLSAQERSDNMTQHYNTPLRLLRQRNKRKRRALA